PFAGTADTERVDVLAVVTHPVESVVAQEPAICATARRPGGSVRTGVLQGCSPALRNARTSPRQGSSQLAFFRAGLPPSGTPVAPGRPNVPVCVFSGCQQRARYRAAAEVPLTDFRRAAGRDPKSLALL